MKLQKYCNILSFRLRVKLGAYFSDLQISNSSTFDGYFRLFLFFIFIVNLHDKSVLLQMSGKSQIFKIQSSCW